MSGHTHAISARNDLHDITTTKLHRRDRLGGRSAEVGHETSKHGTVADEEDVLRFSFQFEDYWFESVAMDRVSNRGKR